MQKGKKSCKKVRKHAKKGKKIRPHGDNETKYLLWERVKQAKFHHPDFPPLTNFSLWCAPAVICTAVKEMTNNSCLNTYKICTIYFRLWCPNAVGHLSLLLDKSYNHPVKKSEIEDLTYIPLLFPCLSSFHPVRCAHTVVRFPLQLYFYC